MMTGQELYSYILHSNIINFTIMISILVAVFKKANLGKIIDSISEDITKNVTSSAEAVQNALSEYKKTKKEARTLDNKKEEIMKNANEIAKNLIISNEEYIKNKQNELDNNSNKLKAAYYDRRIQKTVYEIQEIVYDLSLDAVKNLQTPEIHKRLILNSLDEFDKTEGKCL